MFAGAQISLYPMTDGFVDVILSSLSALDPWRDRLRIETDDISTLIVGPPEVLFPALRDLYVAAAKSGKHVVLRATLVTRVSGRAGRPDLSDRRVGQPVLTIGVTAKDITCSLGDDARIRPSRRRAILRCM